MEYSFQPTVHDISKLEKKVETWQTLHEHSSLNQTAFYKAIAIYRIAGNFGGTLIWRIDIF